nr:MAG TPA: hypothetical protein [Caudoviricetes sp.]
MPVTPCAAVVAFADCIARTACAMCAARLLPRDRCAVRLNSRRRYAPVLPLLAVARVGRGRVVAWRPCCYFGAVLLPPVTITTSTTRPPSAGIMSPAARFAAAVIRRGPLSRYNAL